MHKTLSRAFAAMIIGVCFVPSALAGQMASPEGLWELWYRDSRYQLSLCQGDRLCGTLVWLSPGSSQDPEKVKYLNTPIFNAAKRVGDRTWSGEINLLGIRAQGRVTQVSDDKMELRGCTLGVLCQTFHLDRIEEPASN